MKKTIATVFAALVALAAAAQWHYLPADAGRYTVLHTQNIDTLHKQATTTQRVFNALSTPIRNVYFTRFQVNCLALAEDLNGLAEGAQVCGIALQGQNLGGSRDLTMSFYAQNTPMRDQEVDGLGFAYNPFPDDELLVARDVHCQLPEGEGRTTLFDVNFEPFQYDGDNVLITLDISLPEGDTVNFSFDMAPAAAANALLIRTEQYCINAMTDLLPVFMPDFDFTFNAAQLPAFDMRYYTHDVRGRITDAHGQPLQGLSVRLRDEFTGRRVLGLQLAADGTFVKANVDPEHTFSLTVSADGVDEVTIEGLAFDEARRGDIVLNLQLGRPPLLGDVNGDGELSVADITSLVALILDDDSNERSDINGDGETSVADVTRLVQMVV